MTGNRQLRAWPASDGLVVGDWLRVGDGLADGAAWHSEAMTVITKQALVKNSRIIAPIDRGGRWTVSWRVRADWRRSWPGRPWLDAGEQPNLAGVHASGSKASTS